MHGDVVVIAFATVLAYIQTIGGEILRERRRNAEHVGGKAVLASAALEHAIVVIRRKTLLARGHGADFDEIQAHGRVKTGIIVHGERVQPSEDRDTSVPVGHVQFCFHKVLSHLQQQVLNHGLHLGVVHEFGYHAKREQMPAVLVLAHMVNPAPAFVSIKAAVIGFCPFIRVRVHIPCAAVVAHVKPYIAGLYLFIHAIVNLVRGARDAGHAGRHKLPRE